jgi:hypothetical protein
MAAQGTSVFSRLVLAALVRVTVGNTGDGWAAAASKLTAEFARVERDVFTVLAGTAVIFLRLSTLFGGGPDGVAEGKVLTTRR